MEKDSRAGIQTSSEKVKPITSDKELANRLNYERNNIERFSFITDYIKPIFEGERLVGYATLSFQRGKYGGKRIIINASRNKTEYDEKTEIWITQDPGLAEAVKDTGLSLNSARMFVTNELKEGGYEKIFNMLKELEDSGLYQKLLEETVGN